MNYQNIERKEEITYDKQFLLLFLNVFVVSINFPPFYYSQIVFAEYSKFRQSKFVVWLSVCIPRDWTEAESLHAVRCLYSQGQDGAYKRLRS